MACGRRYIMGLFGLAAIALAAVALAHLAGVAGPKQRPSGDPDFVSPEAALELLVDGAKEKLVFTEGVVVTCDRRVLISDMSAEESRIIEYHPDTRTISVFRSPSGGANGNRMDLACHLLTAERHRLVRTDLATGRADVVVDSDEDGAYDGFNDLAVDSSGGIYVTHPLYGATHPDGVRPAGVYRVDPDGSATLIITDAAKPNGIAICPDEAHLYVGSYDYEAKTEREMALLRYDLAPDGSAVNRRVLVDYTPEHGPDGLVCDSEGNLWVAVRDQSRPGIYAYSVADGVAREKAHIPTPEVPTNVHFGRGDDADYLYITAGNSLYGIRVGKRGHHLQPRLSPMRSRTAGGRGPVRRSRRGLSRHRPGRATIPMRRTLG